MRRRHFVWAALAAACGPLRAWAQTAKDARIGFLWTSDITPQYRDAFLQGLRELGYVEGRSIAVEHRSAANALNRLDALAGEFVALRVQLVVTQGTPAAQAMAKASGTMPVVMALGEPTGTLLIESLGHPGRNVTGLTLLSTELEAKRLELLKQMNPKASRVAVMFDPTVPTWIGARQASVKTVADSMGMKLQLLPVRAAHDLAKAFEAAREARADAILIAPSPLLSFQNQALVDLAMKHRLPAIYGNPQAVAVGGLMSYGPSYTALFHRAATYVDKILKGARPANLPMEQPSKFELLINLKTARALGVTIPAAMLLRADQVIE
jgi:putative ABC transport system substrate-binding protein